MRMWYRMKYKFIPLLFLLCFFNIVDVEANGVFEGSGWEKIIPCMGNDQQSIVKKLEQSISMNNGIISGLTDNYVVVAKDMNGTIVYQEPNYTFANYKIQVQTDSGTTEEHSITSITKNPDAQTARGNNGTTLDLSRFSTSSYTYYIYVTDELLESIPTDSVQYQAITDTSRPGELKFCNSLSDTNVNNTYAQVRPNIALTPPIQVLEQQVSTSFSDWIGAIIDQADLDVYQKEWAKIYWDTPVKERRNEYIKDGTQGDDPIWCAETQVGFETETYHYGDEIEIENNSYCRVQCVEQLSITYGEPVAILAGMGFSYDIKVDTIVDCETRVDKEAIEEKFNEISKSTCTMVPSCWGGIYGQTGANGAGPNEDFDQCITECDGGLYTDECSQQCYSKVYEGEDITIQKPRMLVSPYIVAPVANDDFIPTSNPYPYLAIGQDINYGTFYSCNDYATFYNWITSVVKNPSEYINSGILTQGQVDQIKGEYNEYKNSYIYYCEHDTAYSNWRFPNSSYRYQLDESQGYAFRSLGTGCNAVCSWSGPCTDGVSVTKDDIEKELENLKGEVTIALNQCSTASANFEDQEKSTYTSVITNKDFDDKESDPNSGKTTLSSSYKDQHIDKESSVTAGILKKQVIYRFPETYTSINGEFIYPGDNNSYDISESNLNNFYNKTSNQFLTSLQSRTTNDQWYDWHFENEEEKQAIMDGAANNLVYNGQSASYNIETELRDIGFFEWQFDVDCFYALKTVESSSKTTPEIGGGIDYVFRPIDLLNVFPNEDGDTDNLTANGRVPQWNWSAAAKETTNTGYIIDPVALTETIEEKASAGTTYTENPDYIISLDRQSISEIRAYNDSQKSYLNTDAECKPEDDGRSVCNLQVTGSVFEGVIEINSKVGCNNSQSKSECEIIGGK